jgi:uncharacterized protein (TIGR02421 family)
MKKKPSASRQITERFINDVCDRLANDLQVRRTLPEGGRLHIDRQLPFLLVYRRAPGVAARGTHRLVTSEASYAIVPWDKNHREQVTTLITRIVATLSNEFGAFMLMEVWSTRERGEQTASPTPGFRILIPRRRHSTTTVDRLAKSLRTIRIHRQPAVVDVYHAGKVAPTGFAQLLNADMLEKHGCYLMGLQVDPIYVDRDNEELYPMILQRLRRQLSRALQQGFYEFAHTQTTHSPTHYHALGRNAVSKRVWEIDERLAGISRSFDFLLQVTPANSDISWREFRRRRFEHAPTFHYRPIPIDPELMKRELFNIPIEKIEDPTLAHLFRERQEEIDRQVTMLRDRGTGRFVHGSIQLYGKVSDGLLEIAHTILKRFSSRHREPSRGQLTAREFLECAREEYRYYRSIAPDFGQDPQIRPDIGQSLLVSAGTLLVGKDISIGRSRANALLQHEVGTHVLTYYNGHTQPLQLLYCGLADYDEFQEGIAVLAEYLVDGLSKGRLRVLAARVVGVHAMTSGATFVEVFRLLNRTHGFTQKSAFTITMRIFRGGGLTKDAIYLRGLNTVLTYLREGGDIEPLFVGKIAARHIPIIRELQLRKVLHPAPLLPRYMTDPDVLKRLERVRAGMSIIELGNRN